MSDTNTNELKPVARLWNEKLSNDGVYKLMAEISDDAGFTLRVNSEGHMEVVYDGNNN